MGLGLSLALAFFATQGMKNLFGKPRPDLLARCQPNLSTIASNSIGNYSSGFNPEWVLVDYTICQQTDKSLLDDGFRSFPSGHSSMSWSGLLYLALFFCSKFSIAFPFSPSTSFSRDRAHTTAFSTQNRHQQNSSILPLHTKQESPSVTDQLVPMRNQAAAPPTYLLILPLVPISVAVYISSTRYFQFYHHGFDIIFGSLIGIMSAWFAFRWYQLPIREGAGWAWGARSRERAWGIGIGVAGYVGSEGRDVKNVEGVVINEGDEPVGSGVPGV